jgi:protein-glutamine gamma-glutamyltransferase
MASRTGSPRVATPYAVARSRAAALGRTPEAALGRRGSRSVTRARTRSAMSRYSALGTRLKWPHERPAPLHNVVGAILATGVAGLLFGPAFGSVLAAAVLVPVGAVALAAYLAFEIGRRCKPLRSVRVLLGLLLGAVAIAETALIDTTSGLIPTGNTALGLYEGVRQSWLLVLQSTTPVRAEPELITFVPELVLIAGLLAVEILLRTGSPLGALVPSIVVAALAEGFHPLGVMASVLAVLAYCAAAAIALGVRPSRPNTRSIGYAAAVTVIGALVFGVVDPGSRAAFSLRDHVDSVPSPGAGASPLQDLAWWLGHPDQAAFSVRGTPGIGRWTLAVLNSYDGTDFTIKAHLRYLGAGVQSPHTTGVPTRQLIATVLNDELPGPWLPSQHELDWVSPLHAVVNENNGMLLARGVRKDMQYRLRFTAPQVTPADLERAQLDFGAAGRLILSSRVPTVIQDLARVAVGTGRPSLAMALKLERFLYTHYRLAVGADLPSGHDWGQLIHFLAPGSAEDTAVDVAKDSGKRGTSEQFAAAYVVMARVLGIPARLAVGFSQPQTRAGDGTFVVKNKDALAWPEIAVQGIGWVPLDPEGSPGKADPRHQSSLTRALATLRAQQSPSGKLPTPPKSAVQPVNISIGNSTARWLHGIVVLLLVLATVLLLSVPTLKSVRGIMRRRRVGSAAIISAWRETCDRLVDHGIEVRRSMTVHEVAGSAAAMVDWQLVHAVGHLGDLVDDALWSGDGARPATVQAAWQAVDAVRQGLARRPAAERLAAMLTIRSLRMAR